MSLLVVVDMSVPTGRLPAGVVVDAAVEMSYCTFQGTLDVKEGSGSLRILDIHLALPECTQGDLWKRSDNKPPPN